jgi:L-histidine Nalpha-methyltransferase
MNQFLQDVVKGLSAPAKYLQSKYFYDTKGDALFQQIMQSPEYYLTRCEAEIFTKQTATIAETLLHYTNDFDIVELGAGDASKSIYLLKEVAKRIGSFTYFPIDISSNVIEYLSKKIPSAIDGIEVQGLNGEYLEMLASVNQLSAKPKVILFLGSNIGNVSKEEAAGFCKNMRRHLNAIDMALIGFDLQKDPATIAAAYNDAAGLTRDFNLNLLQRINAELGANFITDLFRHYAVYDPGTGACKSYLISLAEQDVELADHAFHFQKYEPIFMEVSQKYTLQQIDMLGGRTGFDTISTFFDSKQWFVDALWKCV